MLDHQLGTIEKVDIRDVWKSESADFTPWLSENMSRLGDALGMNLESTSIEAEVGGYRLDILARDSDRDSVVAIENQLGETDHSHLGQLLTYTAGYDAKVSIWIARKFREEHRAALDLLNQRTGNDSEFYGVVLALWRIGHSLPAPHFRVVSAPNNWGKIQKSRGSSSQGDQRYYHFFQGLIDELGEGTGIPTPYKVSRRSWQPFKSGYSGFGYVASFGIRPSRRARIELYIDCGDQDENKRRFDQLVDKRNEIESALGDGLHWERLDDKKACRISAYRNGSITDDQEDLDEIQSWMVDTLPRFKKVFDPRLAESISMGTELS